MRTNLALLTATLLLGSATPAAADLLVTNVHGVRATPDRKIERFTGLLVGDDGKVKRVLHGETFKLPAGTRVLNGGGRTLLPGLIDAHGHVMGYGMALGQLDLTGTRSLTELQQRLRDYSAANPDLPWVIGRGWNQELWAEKTFPTSADLDAVVKDRPVWLERVDGHASVANAAAMAAAGVTDATPAPSGGRIERGLFTDAATALVERVIPPPTPEMRRQALIRAQAALLGRGLTAVADMGTSPDDWAAMRRGFESGELSIRIMSYAAGGKSLAALRRTETQGWKLGDRLGLLGVKLYADGALGSRGAWLKQPYADAPTTRGLPLLTPAQLRAEIRAAGPFQIAVHAIGDAANDMVLSAYEANQSRVGDKRWRVEHAQIVDVRDLGRFARDRVIASMQPTHQTSDRLMAEARLGPKRLGGAYAWQTLEKSGARLALGSDFPVEDPDPFPGFAAAVSRQGMDDQPPGGWRPWDKLTLGQALAGFTRDAAYAGFAESRFGALDPGQWADFILVDRDPITAKPHDLARTKVQQTWIAGRMVWSAPVSPSRQK